MKEFEGKTAVITGAAHGIGLAFSIQCAKRGMNVVMADIDADSLSDSAAVVSHLAPSVLPVVCDVTEYNDITELEKRTREHYGNTHLLVNNAGVAALGDFVSMPLIDWDFCIKVNLYGPYYAMRIFMPGMFTMDEPGHIVNIASVSGIVAGPGMPAYHASKYALVGLSESIGTTLLSIGSKLGLTIVCPGMVKTDFNNCDARRPEKYAIDWNNDYYNGPVYTLGKKATDHDVSTGVDPQVVVEAAFEGVEKNRLFAVARRNIPQLEKLLDNRVHACLGTGELDIEVFKEFNDRLKDL